MARQTRTVEFVVCTVSVVVSAIVTLMLETRGRMARAQPSLASKGTVNVHNHHLFRSCPEFPRTLFDQGLTRTTGPKDAHYTCRIDFDRLREFDN